MRATIALVSAFVAGVLLSFGQSYGPDGIAPLFNSAAPIIAIAGFVALGSRQWWGAMLFGGLSGPLVMAGYYLTSHVRGFDTSSSWATVWISGGVIFGLVMGFATWVLRAQVGDAWRAIAAAIWPGIAIGEAWHGLTRISDTTPQSYWIGQAVVGVLVMLWLAGSRVSTWSARLTTLVMTGLIAGALYLLYGVV